MRSRHIETRRAVTALAVFALLTGAATGAQAAPPGGPDRFPISLAEVDAHRAEIFAEIDTNGDGLISAEEFDAAEGPLGLHPGMKPPRHRGEGPGKPTEKQMKAVDDELFDALDADGDGTLSRSEFSRKAMGAVMAGTRKQRIFERADADGDGYLSTEEFPPRRLAALDSNGDGQITRDEIPRSPSRG